MHSWIREYDQYEKLAAIQWDKEDKEYRVKRISLFMRMPGRAGRVPSVVFVEKVVVSEMNKNVLLDFLLRDGSEHKVDWYYIES